MTVHVKRNTDGFYSEFSPTISEAWTQDRPGRSTVHTLYSGRAAAVLRDAGKRVGTIRYVFAGDTPQNNRTKAFGVEVAHAAAGVWHYIDDQMDGVNDLYYVVAEAGVHVEPSDSRNAWIVVVAFAEITP